RRPALLGDCFGKLAPSGGSWFEWMVRGIRGGQGLCEKLLDRYAARGDEHLVVEAERLKKTCQQLSWILENIRAKAGATLGDVGVDHFRVVLQAMLRTEKVSFTFLQESESS